MNNVCQLRKFEPCCIGQLNITRVPLSIPAEYGLNTFFV
jgi:hypothetical protein